MFTENFKEIALDTADYKPTKLHRYVDGTFVIWTHGPEKLQEFLHHINSIRPTIKFPMEVEANDTLPILDVLVMKRGPKLTTKVYRKHTHTGCYLHFKFNHLHHLKESRSYLVKQAKVICQNQNDFNDEIKNIRHDLMLNEYPKEFVDSIMKPPASNRPSSECTRAMSSSRMLRALPRNSDASGTVSISIFKTKHTLLGTLMNTGWITDAQQTKQCVSSILCDCGRCYIGEISRSLEVRIKAHDSLSGAQRVKT
jgi:hypothetical protein